MLTAGCHPHRESVERQLLQKRFTGINPKASSFYSVRSALIGSMLAARLAGTALAANATKATPTTANR
jgi:hypothetical protein